MKIKITKMTTKEKKGNNNDTYYESMDIIGGYNNEMEVY